MWLKSLLDRNTQFGLTIRLSKTSNASREVTFLGYIVEGGVLRPENEIIQKIFNIQNQMSGQVIVWADKLLLKVYTQLLWYCGLSF